MNLGRHGRAGLSSNSPLMVTGEGGEPSMRPLSLAGLTCARHGVNGECNKAAFTAAVHVFPSGYQHPRSVGGLPAE